MPWRAPTGSTPPWANKGTGVRQLCQVLGVDPSEVLAFGDNYNDTAMLDLVGMPYIMDSAAEPLRQRYARHTPRPEDVMAVLAEGGSL